MLNIDVYSTRADIRSQEPLTVGLVGGEAHFRFSDPWKALTKTVVFRQGDVTVDVVGVSAGAVIPWEVLQEPGLPVYIGVYGSDSTGTVVIPTVWAVTDPVLEGTDPMVDASTDATLPVYQQIQGQVDVLNATKPVVLLTGADGLANRTMEELVAAYNNRQMVVYYDDGYLCPLSSFYKDADGNFVFCFRCVDGNMVLREIVVDSARTVTKKTTQLLDKAVFMPVVVAMDSGFGLDYGVTVDDLTAAYNARKVLLCYYYGRYFPLSNITKDENGNFVYHFRNLETDGTLMTIKVYGGTQASVEKTALAEDGTIAPDYTGMATFSAFGVIGDSLSVGGASSGEEGGVDYSWGARIAEKCGNECRFFGVGGATTFSWLSNKLPDVLAADACDAYIIGLGYNDARYIIDSLGQPTSLGTMADIDPADEDLSAAVSYYEGMEKILRALHKQFPTAPLFVLTNPGANCDNFAAYNQALREILAAYGESYNAHLIDLAQLYGEIYAKLEVYRSNNHFPHRIYERMGAMIATAISNYVNGKTLADHATTLANHDDTLLTHTKKLISLSQSVSANEKSIAELLEKLEAISGGGYTSATYDPDTGALTITGSSVSYDETTGELKF